MSATTWRGDDSHVPRVTAKVLRWYRLRLKTWSEEFGERCKKVEAEKGKKMDPPIYPALLDGLADWYADRPDQFLAWRADDEYRGGWYQLGAWSLNFPAIKTVLRQAIREVEAELRREAYAAAGPITTSDVDAALEFLHGAAPLTPEIDGSSLYDGTDQRRWAFLGNGYRAKDHWPRACRRCGEEYKPTRRSQRVTCGDCLAKARTQREATKQRP